LIRHQFLNLIREYVKRKDDGLDLVLQEDKTISEDFGWVFFYTTRRFLKTGDFRDIVGGNAPFIIDHDSGKLTVTGTTHPIEQYIDEYRKRRNSE
jgi:hypothetical protein